ncbi:MAG: KamA family radical SAM protein [bacterium]
MTSSYARRPARWADIPQEQWSDWHWQQQNRLRTLDDLASVVELTRDERDAFAAAQASFRVAVTPHYAALMDPHDSACPIRQQAIPQSGELASFPFELDDPLGEEAHMPVPGITHRYPDRVLFYVTHNCPVYCRHCTRKRKVADPTTMASRSQIEQGLAYLRDTPQVKDVIVSGGDPLTLSDERLDELLGQLRSIQHIDVIRLGTRNPVTLPQRVTVDFAAMLAKHAPIYLHTHFNHPAELTHEAELALVRLVRAGCVLGNQMVLLKGINDDPEIVMQLNRGLLRSGCRPYYMLQCDMAHGITHFRTPLRVGLAILDHLRGRIGGMGIPDFVVDLPGGGGKIELVPNYELERTPDPHGMRYVFRNGDHKRFEFVDVLD